MNYRSPGEADITAAALRASEVVMPKWKIDVDASDDDTIQAYAGDVFAFGTEGDMYVAYVVVTSFINKMLKSVDKDNG